MKKICTLLLISAVIGCTNNNEVEKQIKSTGWKQRLKEQLPIYGHRNWILIVDKAFPSQNANGIITINTNENLLDVLDFSLKQIDSSKHVKANIFTDKELSFITKNQVQEIENYRSSLYKIIQKYNPQTMLHDSVFVKIDKASKLFSILILKTNEVIPYSSVFIQLDCKYWTEEKEKQLRKVMKAHE